MVVTEEEEVVLGDTHLNTLTQTAATQSTLGLVLKAPLPPLHLSSSKLPPPPSPLSLPSDRQLSPPQQFPFCPLHLWPTCLFSTHTSEAQTKEKLVPRHKRFKFFIRERALDKRLGHKIENMVCGREGEKKIAMRVELLFSVS